jgi:hypothetical protein
VAQEQRRSGEERQRHHRQQLRLVHPILPSRLLVEDPLLFGQLRAERLLTHCLNRPGFCRGAERARTRAHIDAPSWQVRGPPERTDDQAERARGVRRSRDLSAGRVVNIRICASEFARKCSACRPRFGPCRSARLRTGSLRAASPARLWPTSSSAFAWLEARWRYDLKLWIGHPLEGAAYLPRRS